MSLDPAKSPPTYTLTPGGPPVTVPVFDPAELRLSAAEAAARIEAERTGGSGLVPTSRDHPCPRCRRSNGDCWFRPDLGQIACRKDHTGEARADRNGRPYYLHDVDTDMLPDLGEARGLRRPSRLTPEQLHQGYTAMARLTHLSSAHTANLQARGLNFEARRAAGYGTLRSYHRSLIVDRLTSGKRMDLGLTWTEAGRIVPHLPGFYWREGSSPQTRTIEGDLRLGGPDGLLIPVRDPHGRIHCQQIRIDDADRLDAEGNEQLGKYIWLSASDKGGASPALFVHTPAPGLRPPDCSTVLLTEGPLKADVSTVLGATLTLGCTGVGMWREFLPVLAALPTATGQRVKTVRLAFDADCWRKIAVAEALRDLGEALLAQMAQNGPDVQLLLWQEKDGKGLDDLLAAGRLSAARLVHGEGAVREALAEIVAHAHRTDPRAAEIARARQAEQERRARRRRTFDGELPDELPELVWIMPRSKVSSPDSTPDFGAALQIFVGTVLAQVLANEQARREAEAASQPATEDDVAHQIALARADFGRFPCPHCRRIAIRHRQTCEPQVIDVRCERWNCEGCRGWQIERTLAHAEFRLGQAEHLYEFGCTDEQWPMMLRRLRRASSQYFRMREGEGWYVVCNRPIDGAIPVTHEIAIATLRLLLDEYVGDIRPVSTSHGWRLPREEQESQYTRLGYVASHVTLADLIEAADDVNATVDVQRGNGHRIQRRYRFRRQQGWDIETCERLAAHLFAGEVIPDVHLDWLPPMPPPDPAQTTLQEDLANL